MITRTTLPIEPHRFRLAICIVVGRAKAASTISKDRSLVATAGSANATVRLEASARTCPPCINIFKDRPVRRVVVCTEKDQLPRELAARPKTDNRCTRRPAELNLRRLIRLNVEIPPCINLPCIKVVFVAQTCSSGKATSQPRKEVARQFPQPSTGRSDRKLA
jgi:hypothetical protein